MFCIRRIKVATSDPAACDPGYLLFRSDAPAGSNIKLCTSTNVWTQLSVGPHTRGAADINSGTLDAARLPNPSAGKQVVIAYTFRPIQDALAGVLERAKSQRRTVNIDTMIKTHEGAAQTVAELYQRYSENPNVKVRFIDNSGTRSKVGTIELTQKQHYGGTGEELHGILGSKRGEVSKSIYEVTQGGRPRRKSRSDRP